jgi:hypothetical protein
MRKLRHRKMKKLAKVTPLVSGVLDDLPIPLDRVRLISSEFIENRTFHNQYSF